MNCANRNSKFDVCKNKNPRGRSLCKSVNILIAGLFMISTVGCSVISQIQRSTKIINENQCAVQNSTRVINDNSEVIAASTHVIRDNHEHVNLTSDAIKENLQAIADSSQAISENARTVKESSKTIAENQKIIERSNQVIAKNAETVERLSGSIEHFDPMTIFLVIGGVVFLILFPWIFLLAVGRRINKNLQQLIITLKKDS